MSWLVNCVTCHGSPRLPWHVLGTLLLGVLLFQLPGAAPEMLVYDRQAVSQGQLWRLLTAHWVHSDASHLFWNMLGLLVLGGILESGFGPRRFYQSLLMGMLGVSGWLWFFMPGLELYCGLSGVLNSVLFVLLVDGWRRDRHAVFILVAFLALAKIGVEMSQAAAIFTATSWPSVPAAHLAGAIAGVLFVLPHLMRQLPGPWLSKDRIIHREGDLS